MSSEIKREKIYGNFKPAKGYARPRETKERARDRRPGMSDAHLSCIRRLPCCVCGKGGCEAHHLKQGTGERGAGQRSTDQHTVPLCPIAIGGHHAEVEAAGSKNERKWFLDRGIDALALADALWRSTGDVERMERIVEAHKS